MNRGYYILIALILSASVYAQCQFSDVGPQPWKTIADNVDLEINDRYAIKHVIVEDHWISNGKCNNGRSGFNWNEYKVTATIQNKGDDAIFKISAGDTVKEENLAKNEEKTLIFEYEGDNGKYDVSVNVEIIENKPFECRNKQRTLTPRHFVQIIDGIKMAAIGNDYEYNDVCYDFNSQSEIKITKAAEGIYWFYTPEQTGSWGDENGTYVPFIGTYYAYYCSDKGCFWSATTTNTCQSNTDCEIMNPNNPGSTCDFGKIPYDCTRPEMTEPKVYEQQETLPHVQETVQTEEITIEPVTEEIRTEPVNEESPVEPVNEVEEQIETQPEPLPVETIPPVKNEIACNGCLKDEKCLPMGTRTTVERPVFCSLEQQWNNQKDELESCENNYECLSNFCSNQQCYDITKEVKETKSVIQRVIDWLSNVFGFAY